MKVLLVGGGGREHAIAWALRKSKRCAELLCAPGNAGIAALARCFPDVKATDIEGIVALALREGVDYCVVAPDDPIALGCVDALTAAGVPAFGPTRAAARIEYSKAYAKDVMARCNIPTACYASFGDYGEALAYVKAQALPLFIKADGLALGKGAVRADTMEEADAALRAMLLERRFGDAGARVLVEECMTGPEVTQLCFVDGEHISLMPVSRDHKRALDGDRGLNTGGMGAVAPCAGYDEAMRARVLSEVILPLLDGMRAEGAPFKGVLYAGLMLTAEGPKVIEFNARFGDPETQAVLPLLKSDLLEVMLACTNGALDALDIAWSDEHCACVVLASGGYPEQYVTGYPIEGLEDAARGALVFHAGTRLDGGRVVTAGGRVLGVSATAGTIDAAIEAAYAAAAYISFKDMHMRRDIGRTY